MITFKLYASTSTNIILCKTTNLDYFHYHQLLYIFVIIDEYIYM